MITYIDSNNIEQYNAYQKLFSDAMKALGSGVNIDSLETYFSHIKDLIDIDRKYSMLPLQEQYFDIDANARTITVPEVFRKNGLGVQGDKTAETIYFKINRYFDAMDLDKTDIYIRWENAAGESGFSTEWVRDIETFDDYLIFGWVLGNTITETPGILKFSVSFIKKNNDNNVTYALNTLTAQALINASLDAPIGVPDNSLNDLLIGNIENTTTFTDSEIKIFEFVDSFNNLIASDNSNLSNNIIMANLVKNNETNEYSLELLLSAYVDIGSLSYQIYKLTGEKPDIKKDINLIATTDIIYKEVEHNEALPNHKYYQYVKDSAGSIQYDENGNPLYEYIFVAPGTSGMIKTEEADKYFEKYGYYKLTKPNAETNITGTYYGTAISEINMVKSSPITTPYWVKIPGPKNVIFKSDTKYSGYAINSTIIPEFTKHEEDEITYIWYKVDGDNKIKLETTSLQFIPTEQGFYNFEVKTSRNLDSIFTTMPNNYCVTPLPDENDIQITSPTVGGTVAPNTTITIAATYQPNNPIADYGISYQWQKVSGPTDSPNYTDIENANSAHYTFKESGKYVCKIIATYNDLQTYKHSVEFIVD